jgi:hypothetical protein
MKSVQRANVNTLQSGTVLLVDTEDNCFKLILDQGRVFISWVDSDTEIEKPHGMLTNRNLVVGEPFIGMSSKEGVFGTFETSPVKTIEIYEDVD